MKNLIKSALLVALLSVSGNAFSKPMLMSDKPELCDVVAQTTFDINNAFHTKSNVEFRYFVDSSIAGSGGGYTAYGVMNYIAELVETENDSDSDFVRYITLSRCKRLMTNEVILELNRLDEDSRIPAFLGYMVYNIDFNK